VIRIEPGLDSLNRNPEECELQACESNAPPDRSVHILLFTFIPDYIHFFGTAFNGY
jgi:hypothetical protein